MQRTFDAMSGPLALLLKTTVGVGMSWHVIILYSFIPNPLPLLLVYSTKIEIIILGNGIQRGVITALNLKN